MWIVNHIFKKYGVGEISTEEFRENWTQPPALFYQKYLPEGYNEEERSKLFQKLQLDKDYPEAVSFPEVVKVMLKCKENEDLTGGFLRLGILSAFRKTLFSFISKLI
jgi:hypothetical protein